MWTLLLELFQASSVTAEHSSTVSMRFVSDSRDTMRQGKTGHSVALAQYMN